MAYRLIIYITVLFLLSFGAHAADGKKQGNKKNDGQLLTRIDFGNSYITGQSLKSGAVYLLQRKKSEVKTMLNYRENYRKEILESHDIDGFKEKKQVK